jgi:outer membrane lipoprotein
MLDRAHTRTTSLRRAASLAAFLCLVAGCASKAPAVIRDAPAVPLDVAEVQQQAERYRDTLVRWGGQILGLENRARTTWVRILSRELDNDGYPDPDASAGSRFVARVPGFLDPAEYAPDRLITVVGRVSGSVKLPVGDYPYRHVLVDVQAYHLWPIPIPVSHYPPYPWYDPWYPWHRPWWRRPYW